MAKFCTSHIYSLPCCEIAVTSSDSTSVIELMNTRTRAISFMLTALVLQSITEVTFKYLAPRLSGGAILLVRSSIILLVFLPLMIWGKVRPFKTYHLKTQIWRSIFAVLSMVFTVAALSHINLLEFSFLFYVNPIVTMVAGILFLQERLNKMQIISFSLCIVGFFILFHPHAHVKTIGAIWAVGAAVCYSISMIFTKLLAKDEPLIAAFSYYTLFCFAYGLASQSWTEVFQISQWDWTLLVMLAAINAAIMIALVSALSLAPISSLIHYNYINLPLSLLWGYILWGHIPTTLAIVGGSFIVMGSFIASIPMPFIWKAAPEE